MKILLAVSRYPWPSRRGDQLRAAQFVELLAPEHELTLLAPEPPAGAPRPPVACRLELYRRAPGLRRGVAVARALVTGGPLQNGLFDHPDLAARLRKLAPRADLVILQLVRMASYLDELGETPVAVDLIDSLSLNMERRALYDAPWLGPALRLEARRLAKAERRLLAAARGGLVVCERDRRSLLGEPPSSLVAERLAVLPLAFPLRAGEEPVVPLPGEPTADGGDVLVMTGNLGYFPAVEGFGWWLRRVWPELHRRRPQLRVVLAGARPAASLRRLARAPGVELLDSPPDLATVLAGARVALAPLRCGSGQPLKILEAWQAGVPVVASPWAAAGTAARDGEDLVVAGEPAEWVAAVERLLDEPALARCLVLSARRRLAADYGRDTVGAGLRRWVCECADSASRIES